jgi:beta-glucosidase
MTPLPSFPDDFLWGTATSAYQIEGSPTADGKGVSIWDTFAHTPGKILTGETGDVACDHYRRWEQDLDLLAEIGCTGYRFSISWPRILPSGIGQVESRGLDFYDRLVDGLVTRGIKAFPTLYHWDLPQALQDRGGWYDRDTARAFADYARIVAERIGDRSSAFITLNEPSVHTFFGHVAGVHAPGLYDLPRVFSVIHHQLLAHGLGVAAIRSASSIPVGLTNNHSPIIAQDSSSEGDILAAERMDLLYNRQYLDPVLLSRSPGDPVELYGPLAADVIRDGDMETIGAPMDFLGVNYYNPQWVKAPGPDNPLGFELVDAPTEFPRTAFDWPVVPDALTDLLLRLRSDYATRLPPLYITENGTSWPEPVHDQFRIDYLDSHLRAVAAAMAEGVDIRGYFCWTLLDNFEWAEGTKQRFGLINVDFQTQQRTVRDSGRWFARMSAGGLS